LPFFAAGKYSFSVLETAGFCWVQKWRIFSGKSKGMGGNHSKTRHVIGRNMLANESDLKPFTNSGICGSYLRLFREIVCEGKDNQLEPIGDTKLRVD